MIIRHQNVALHCLCGHVNAKRSFIGPARPNSAPVWLSVQVGGQLFVVMLSLDEPLDLKLPRRANGWDRGARSPPISPLHPKRARQLRMADDGTAVIDPASPGSPHSGNNKAWVCSLDLSSPSEHQNHAARTPMWDPLGERSSSQACLCVFSGVQVVPHDWADTPTPPAVDLSMSPSSRHTASSPEMTNGNYIASGVSVTTPGPSSTKETRTRLPHSILFGRIINELIENDLLPKVIRTVDKSSSRLRGGLLNSQMYTPVRSFYPSLHSSIVSISSLTSEWLKE